VNTVDRTSEAKTLDRKKIIFEAKRTPPSVSKFFLSEANTLDRNKIIFKAKQTRPTVSKLFSKQSKHVRQ
jgi:hypothetical protein